MEEFASAIGWLVVGCTLGAAAALLVISSVEVAQCLYYKARRVIKRRLRE